MRVLWFVNTPSAATETLTGNAGVAGGWIESLEKKLSAQEDVELGVAFPWSTRQVESFELEDGGTQYYKLPLYPFGKWARLLSRVTNQIEPAREVEGFLKVIEIFEPDVINIFGSERGFGQIIPHTKIPVAIWIQGNLTVYTHKWYSGLTSWQALKGTRLLDFIKGTSLVHSYFQTRKAAQRERSIMAQAEHLSGRTDWDRRLTATLAPKATYYHCDEIMRPAFYSQQWVQHGSRDRVMVLTTIRTNIYKGLETLFRAAALLHDQVGDAFTWRVAGISPDDTLVRVTAGALDFRYQDLPIELLGNQTSEQLAAHMLNSDIFVHPSHIDNSPNSVCEAMLMGLPVVSTNVGGIPSLLKNEEEGLLVQNGDPWALAGAMLEMIRDPDKAARMGQNARKRAAVRHDPNKICNDLMRIYSRLRESKD